MNIVLVFSQIVDMPVLVSAEKLDGHYQVEIKSLEDLSNVLASLTHYFPGCVICMMPLNDEFDQIYIDLELQKAE